MRLRGQVFRAHNPRWAFAPASGEGAARYGGRFNPRGVPALYTSLRMETAWLEAQQGFPFKPQPLTLCAYEVDCAEAADLTDPDELRRWSVDASDLACPWEDLAARGLEPPSWALAERLRRDGTAAVVVPSFAPGAGADDRNAVFWRWEDDGCRLAVIDPAGRLPRDDASWR